jgi:hypothetical protein
MISDKEMIQKLRSENNLIYAVHKETKEVRYFQIEWGSIGTCQGRGWLNVLRAGEKREAPRMFGNDNRQPIEPDEWDFIPYSIVGMFLFWKNDDDGLAIKDLLERYYEANKDLIKTVMKSMSDKTRYVNQKEG